MQHEVIVKHPPYSLKIIVDGIVGYVFSVNPETVYETDLGKLRNVILEHIETLKNLLEEARQ